MEYNDPRRGIKEEPSFTAACERIRQSAKRLDAILQGVRDVIVDYPEAGGETDKPGVRGIATRDWPDAPEMVLYYRYDDRFIYEVDLQLVQALEDQE